jgi:hypothetical protein
MGSYMSLTTLLKNQALIERFKQELECPKLDVNYKLLAPPVTRRYPLVGTAFDYLLRFHIRRINPIAITQPWVAEIGAALVYAGVITSTAVKYKIIKGKVARVKQGPLQVCL